MSVDELIIALTAVSERGHGDFAVTLGLDGRRLYVSNVLDPDPDQLEVPLEVSG